eukprot:3695053-Rhodomonas_salina.2
MQYTFCTCSAATYTWSPVKIDVTRLAWRVVRDSTSVLESRRWRRTSCGGVAGRGIPQCLFAAGRVYWVPGTGQIPSRVVYRQAAPHREPTMTRTDHDAKSSSH